MKQLPKFGKLSWVLLVVAGCDTRTLIGREPVDPPAAPDGGSQVVSGQPDATVPPPGPVGDDEGGSRLDARADEINPPPPMPPIDQPFTIPDALVGTWTGYFQAFHLMSGSDALTLKLIREPGHPDRATLTLGEGPPLVTTGVDPLWGAEPRKDSGPPEYFERFEYSAHQVKWRGNRLTFLIEAREPFGDWCAMRTSYPVGNGRYACVPGDGGSVGQEGDHWVCDAQTGGVITPVDCKLYTPCIWGMCACTAGGCTAGVGHGIQFDVTFDTVGLGAWDAPNATFRLQRN